MKKFYAYLFFIITVVIAIVGTSMHFFPAVVHFVVQDKNGMATLLWTFIIKSFDSIALVTDNSKMSVISYY